MIESKQMYTSSPGPSTLAYTTSKVWRNLSAAPLQPKIIHFMWCLLHNCHPIGMVAEEAQNRKGESRRREGNGREWKGRDKGEGANRGRREERERREKWKGWPAREGKKKVGGRWEGKGEGGGWGAEGQEYEEGGKRGERREDGGEGSEAYIRIG